MGFEALLPVAASLIGGISSANSQDYAARLASDQQAAAGQAGIDQQNKQFDAVQKLLAPYVQAGTGAIGQQQNLAGLNGNDAQSQAIQALQQSPAFTAAQKLGENRILANASATGGLRGGNTQSALAQFNPQLLAQTINDQYSRLGGLTSMGQNAAAGVGNAGMQTGNNVSNLLGQIGQAQAGGALGVGRSQMMMNNGIAGSIGQLFGGGGLGGGSMGALQARFGSTGLGQAGFGSGLAYGNQDLGAFF